MPVLTLEDFKACLIEAIGQCTGFGLFCVMTLGEQVMLLMVVRKDQCNSSFLILLGLAALFPAQYSSCSRLN